MVKRLIGLAALLTVASAPLVAQVGRTKVPTAPEQFSINANVTGDAGASAATFVIAVDRYSSDKEREALQGALKKGGYQSFLPALRQAPAVGHLEAGQRKWDIRFARQQTTPKGRTIVIVTDQPIFFVGGGLADAKPREGYGCAVAQFDVDDVGLGSGTIAAAARVKLGGPAGVQVDDYAEKPIKLTTVRRLPS